DLHASTRRQRQMCIRDRSEIAKYWLEKGIDGLRLDAFIHIAKADLRQNFPVNSENEEPVIAEPFFANLPQVQKWMRPFCEEIKQDYPDALLLGEAASANVNLAVDYTNKDNHLMDSVITFRYFTEDQSQIDPSFSAQYQPKSLDLVKFKQNQAVWQQTLSGVSKPTLYWNNHDMARIATRIAKNDIQARSLAMLMYLQNGLPIIYYGEELGMKNLEFEDATQFEDETVKEFIESAKKAGKTSQEALLMASKTHKLPARGPMPWNNEKNNGFSDGNPWLKGKKVDYANAADEIADNHSMFNFYKKLIALKKEALFEDGGYYLLPTSNDSYVYERNLEDQKALVAVSLSKDPIELDVDPEFKQEKLVAGNYQLKDGKLKLAPYAGVVLEKD
ncbi:MAG: alpha-amylase family glycosyl hydrolase, partial [Lactobacillus gasseri]|nr:alpha-amylase family glycosyl hydrolase [Lactobacillus gasseri]